MNLGTIIVEHYFQLMKNYRKKFVKRMNEKFKIGRLI